MCSVPQRSTARTFACLLVAVLSLQASGAIAQAKPNPMDASAEQIAGAISGAKLSKVIVFDFSGPDKKITQLGHDFAAEFRRTLAKVATNFQVEDAQEVDDALAKISYAPEIILYPESQLAAAQELHASGFVIGQVSTNGNKLTLDVSAYRAKDGKGLRSMQMSWTLTDDLRALVEKKIEHPDFDDGGGPVAGPNDKHYTTPKCLFCPRADFSEEAAAHNIEGVAEFVVVVGEDGRVTNVRIIRPLPYGLTAKAMEAIRRWKLSPVLGPDGKPARVRQLIEVTFRHF